MVKKNNSQIIDLIIVGAGPIGMTCAIEAKKANLNYLVLEKGTLVNTLFHFPTNMTFFSTSQLLEIGGVPFIAHGDKPTRREALEYFRRVYDSWKLNIHFYEKVTSVEKKKDLFNVLTTKSDYKTKNIIFCTGFYDQARMLNIPGEDLPKVKHYYDEPHPYVGQKVIVVGAANSACDVALELFHKGSDVTMVIREEEISQRVKYWIRPNIENRIKEGSIKAHFKSQLVSITQNSVLVQTPEGTLEIPNDFVLAMTGYKPDFNQLQELGVKIEESEDGNMVPVYDETSHMSNIQGLYLAGVLCGGTKTSSLFIENSRIHGRKIISHILLRKQD